MTDRGGEMLVVMPVAAGLASDIGAGGGRARAMKADSTDPDRLASSVDRAADFLGGLDIFVSSAGALPFKPIDSPADVGALVAFLASADAGFITGSIQHVDNGFTA